MSSKETLDFQILGNDMLNKLYCMFERQLKSIVTDKKLRKRMRLHNKALSLIMSDRFMNGRS